MTIWLGIPKYIWINIITILGTILVLFLIYRRLGPSFKKRLTAYFLRTICFSLIISLGVSVAKDFLFFLLYQLGLRYDGVTEYLRIILTVALPLTCFVVTFSLKINRRVRYVEYLSREIRLIREEGFGRVMELQGDDEITQLCASINEMSLQLKEKEELERKQLQSKNELITNVSHDLRSPLTSIIGYVDLLKSTGPEDRQKFDEYIEVVERRLTGLNELINELFEYTKLNSAEKPPDMERTDVLELLRHILYENRILMEVQGLTLSWQLEAESYVADMNQQQMVRVFQNLLDNARKYADRSAPVTVTARADTVLHICIVNRVADTEGLEPEQMFERFYRADKARSDTNSSGLGLAIVKRIVELHGGEISASVQGQELSVCLVLRGEKHE